MDVPFETVDSRIYVAVQVDGRGPFRFAVDTGASGTARADARLAAALGAARGAGASTSDGVRTAAVDTTRLRSIALDGLVRDELDVITRDYAGRVSAAARFDGILARDFFADGLLVIDYRARRLRFSRGTGLAPDAADALPYERAFRIPVTIGDMPAIAQLDTGADVALVLPRALYDRVANAPLKAAGGATLANGRIETQRARLAGPVRIGEVHLRDVEARVSADFPEMLVGAPALAGAVVLIDPRTKRVAICR
ncbi:aspartyl protease family protein [Lysobacter humi (ex Lee et al. 2017)]